MAMPPAAKFQVSTTRMFYSIHSKAFAYRPEAAETRAQHNIRMRNGTCDNLQASSSWSPTKLGREQNIIFLFYI